MNMVRKPESQRGPQLARSAKDTVPGIRIRGRPLRRAGRAGSARPGPRRRRSRPARAAGSPRWWPARTARTRSAATTPPRTPTPARRSAPRRRRRPCRPGRCRPLALTRVRPSGQQAGYGGRAGDAVRLGRHEAAQREREEPRRLGRDRGRQPPDQERADRHRRADRPAPAVAEPVEERPDQRRHDRERQHRQAEEQRDLAAGLARRDLEEQRAGQRDRHGGVAGRVEGVHLDQPGQARAVGALGAGGAPRLAQGVPPGAAGARARTPATARPVLWAPVPSGSARPSRACSRPGPGAGPGPRDGPVRGHAPYPASPRARSDGGTRRWVMMAP